MEINESGRSSGKKSKLITVMREQLLKDGIVHVCGIHNPEHYTSELKKRGIEVIYEPLETIPPQKIIFDFWGEPIGLETPKKKLTGYKYIFNDLLDPKVNNVMPPVEFLKTFGTPNISSEYTRQIRKIHKDIKPLPFLRSPIIPPGKTWDDIVKDYLYSEDKLNRGSVNVDGGNERQTGYYWVKFKGLVNFQSWNIAYYDLAEKTWESPFFKTVIQEDYLTEINETRIKNPDEK